MSMTFKEWLQGEDPSDPKSYHARLLLWMGNLRDPHGASRDAKKAAKLAEKAKRSSRMQIRQEKLKGCVAEIEALADELLEVSWPPNVVKPGNVTVGETVSAINKKAKRLRKAAAQLSHTDAGEAELGSITMGAGTPGGKGLLSELRGHISTLQDWCPDPGFKAQLSTLRSQILALCEREQADGEEEATSSAIDKALELIARVGEDAVNHPLLNCAVTPLNYFIYSYLTQQRREGRPPIAIPEIARACSTALAQEIWDKAYGTDLHWMRNENIQGFLARIAGWAWMFAHANTFEERHRNGVLAYYRVWLSTIFTSVEAGATQASECSATKSAITPVSAGQIMPPTSVFDFASRVSDEKTNVPRQGTSDDGAQSKLIAQAKAALDEAVDSSLHADLLWPKELDDRKDEPHSLQSEYDLVDAAVERLRARTTPNRGRQKIILPKSLEWHAALQKLGRQIRDGDISNDMLSKRACHAAWHIAHLSKLAFFYLLPAATRDEPREGDRTALLAAMTTRMNGILKDPVRDPESTLQLLATAMPEVDDDKAYSTRWPKTDRMFGKAFTEAVKTLSSDCPDDVGQCVRHLYLSPIDGEQVSLELRVHLVSYLVRLADDCHHFRETIWNVWRPHAQQRPQPVAVPAI